MPRGTGERYSDYITQDEESRRPSMQLTPEQAAVLARSAAMYPDVPAGTHIAAMGMGNGDQVMEMANMAAQNAAPPKPKKKKSLFQRATGAAGFVAGHATRGVGLAGDFLTPKPVEQVLDPLGDIAQPTIRAAGTVLATPLQTVVGAGREAYGLATGQIKWEGWNDLGNDIAEQTSLGQVFKQWGLPGTGGGEFNPGAEIDLGSGFFPGQDTDIERARHEKELATAKIGNSAWTPGRWMAVDLLGADQGSTAYNILSGLGDATVAWFADPANIALNKVAKAGRLAKTGTTIVGEGHVLRAAEAAEPGWRAVVDEAMGLVPGSYKAPRDSVLSSRAAEWLYGDQGRKYVEKIRDIGSTTQLWEDTGMKFPLPLAEKLARSSDEVEIVNTLVDALTTSVRELPGRQLGPTGVANRLVKNRQHVGRLFNMVPDTRIEWDDIEGSFRNIRNSLANVGIHGEQREELMNLAAKALTAPGNKKQLRYEFTQTWGKMLNAQLRAVGVPDEVADAATQWTKVLDQVNAYDVNDAARGISFADDAGTGPFLVSQLLDTGMYLYDPKAVRQLREMTSSKAIRWLAKNRGWRGGVSLAAGFQNELWKPMQLIGPKYLTKILPEEYGRVALGGAIEGPLGWLRTVFGDQYSMDPTGGAFATIAQRADSLVDEKMWMEDALRTATDPADKKLLAEQIAEVDNELAALNDEISSHANDVYSQAMNRKYSQKAGVDYGSNQLYEEGRITSSDRAMRDHYEQMLRQQVRRGQRQTVNATQDIERWATAQGESILGLHADPVARRIANGGIFPGDDPTGTFRSGIDGIVDWLNLGAGKAFRDDMEAFALSRNPQFKGSIARRMVEMATDDLLYRTGNDPELLDAIVSGKIAGDNIIGKVGAVTGNIPSSELKDVLKRVWNEQSSTMAKPDISEYASHVSTEVTTAGAKARDLERAMQVKDQMTRWFFQSVYGKYSDKLNRSPAFRSFMWRRVEELLPHMEPATARAMLDEAKGTIPSRQFARMEKAAAKANGDLDREAVKQLAGHAALEDTTDLLFDATKRTQLFDVVRVIMPFGEAWREIITSYSRLFRQNPRAWRRFQQAIGGLRGAGIMYKDEYGEESIAIPYSGPLTYALTMGQSKADFHMAARSLSIGTSVIPGLGPALAGPVYKFIPDEPGTEWVRNMLFPYGEPQALDALPVPAWAQKLIQSTGWVDGKTALSTNNAVMNQLYIREPEKYANDPELLIADAKAVSQGVLMARGIAQAFSPGAPTVRYVAETPNGDVVAAKLSDEFRKMQVSEEEGGQGLDYNDAVEEFLDKYGPGAALYIVGNTQAQIRGLDASKDFSNFEKDNGWLFTEHKEIGGYFGPHGGEFDYTTYVRQLEAGYRRALTPDERLAAANQVIGNMMVRNEEERLESQKPRDQWGQYEKAYLGWYKSELEKELFGYTRYDSYDVNETRRQMDDLFDAANDKRLENNTTAQAVRQYQAERDKMLQMAAANGYSGISESNATLSYRAYLSWYGDALAKEVPSFHQVWDRLLSREVELDAES